MFSASVFLQNDNLLEFKNNNTSMCKGWQIFFIKVGGC